MRKVLVTGIGAVTPIGSGVEGLWAGVKAERSAIRTIQHFNPCEFNCHIAAEIGGQERDPVAAIRLFDDQEGGVVVAPGHPEPLMRREQIVEEATCKLQARLSCGASGCPPWTFIGRHRRFSSGA